MSKRVLCVVVTLMVGALAQFVVAEGTAPELPWLHEGLLITLSWNLAAGQGNIDSFVEDEHGEWVLSPVGQRDHRVTRQPTNASGFTQLTLARIDAGHVVVVSQGFANAAAVGINEAVPLLRNFGFVAPATEAEGNWIDPKKLAARKSDAAHGVSVESVRWKNGERMIDAIRIQRVDASGYNDWIYDCQSGQCIHYGTAAPADGPPKDNGPGDAPREFMLTNGDLVAVRDLSVPWASEPMPPAIATAKSLRYRGTLEAKGAIPAADIFMDMTVLERGDACLTLSLTSQMQMQLPGTPPRPPETSRIACGRAQFGGLWTGPVALSKLHEGQLLDEDPLTKMRTSVTKVTDDSVIISQTNAGGEIANEYDRHSGLLISISYLDAITKRNALLRLRGKPEQQP